MGVNDRVNYSESIKINIGDYESKQIGMSLSTDIRKGETFEIAMKRARTKVKKELLALEKKERKYYDKFVDFDHNLDKVK